MAKKVKTNAMRQLDSANVEYGFAEYTVDEDDLSGLHIAKEFDIDPKIMYKTLVTRSDNGVYYVYCLACDEELDMKKCARAAGEKRVEMIMMKDLLPVTGYIRGGCSPIGMKKKYKTFISEKAKGLDKIYVSAGERGKQIIINPNTLISFIFAEYADIIK